MIKLYQTSNVSLLLQLDDTFFFKAQISITENHVIILVPIGQFIDGSFSKNILPTFYVSFAELFYYSINNYNNKLLLTFIL